VKGETTLSDDTDLAALAQACNADLGDPDLWFTPFVNSQSARKPGTKTAKGERMGSERIQLIVSAAMAAIAPIVICVMLITLCSRAANGRLPRNQWAGIRTPATMRSDQSWMAGHRAALRLTPVYLLTTAIALGALLWAGLYASTNAVVMVTGLGAVAVLVALLMYTAIIANKAAKSVGDQPDDRHRQ
jgi:hypothetical protein